MKLGQLLKKLRPKSLQGDGTRPVDNTDAVAAGPGTQKDPMGVSHGTAPPGYVPGADEGRPRH